jgi:selenide, water dikinase
MNQRPTTPPERELVLVGGGHSHALLVRQLGEQPLPNLRVTLVSDSACRVRTRRCRRALP